MTTEIECAGGYGGVIVGLIDGSSMDGSGVGSIASGGVVAGFVIEFGNSVEGCIDIVGNCESAKSFELWGDVVFE